MGANSLFLSVFKQVLLSGGVEFSVGEAERYDLIAACERWDKQC